MKNIKTKIELEKWARRCLIEAMLANIPFKIIAESMLGDWKGSELADLKSKLSQFAMFGGFIDDEVLRKICDYFGAHDPVADKVSEELYDEYYRR